MKATKKQAKKEEKVQKPVVQVTGKNGKKSEVKAAVVEAPKVIVEQTEDTPKKAAASKNGNGTPFREGSNTLKIYNFLRDGKKHTRQQIANVVGVKEDRYPHVFARLCQVGAVSKKFTIEVANGEAQMTVHSK